MSTTWADSRLVKKTSKISGDGIFVNNDIKKGEVLMIFGGEIVSKKNLTEKKYRLQTAFPISQDEFIVLPVSNTQDTIDEYLNHSCNPTAWLIDEVTVVARRNIKKGQEITVDVATWDIDEEWLFSDDGLCYCGKKICRKILNPQDYKRPELQKRYKGHFSPYIQNLIEGK